MWIAFYCQYPEVRRFKTEWLQLTGRLLCSMFLRQKNMHHFWVTNYFWKCRIAASLALLSVLTICLTLPMYLLGDSKNKSLQIQYGPRFLMKECPSPGTFIGYVCFRASVKTFHSNPLVDGLMLSYFVIRLLMDWKGFFKRSYFTRVMLTHCFYKASQACSS